MSTFALPMFHKPNGRIRGSYCYMLMCQDRDGPIYIKIGMSDAPERRLEGLRTGCAITPKVLAQVELPSRRAAYSLETDLHRQLAPWRSSGEWFCFDDNDKRDFNDIVKNVFLRHAQPGWPLSWSKKAI